ncbi:Beta-lactamase precursor [Clavibacter michiganensis]|uniref:Beta-lactamase n=1 Tax=Clavibacter michiganensis TaxID=28447 RepID=A0A251XXF7_9MICO|nr:Beta-lactamase precursor [Clavibacter michiganensis]
MIRAVDRGRPSGGRPACAPAGGWRHGRRPSRSRPTSRRIPLSRSPLALALPLASALAAALLAGCATPAADPTPPATGTPTASAAPATLGVDQAAADAAFTALEERFDARLGVHLVDTATGAEVSWRADERFAYASTIKAPLAAALLDRVGIAGMDRAVPIEAADVLSYAPVTETRVGGTMTLRELAEAAMTRSDNTAANLLLEALGGPAELDAALTALGDETTVVSRREPDLNEATPGDDRDTTTRAPRPRSSGPTPWATPAPSRIPSTPTSAPSSPAGCRRPRRATRSCAPSCPRSGPSATSPARAPTRAAATSPWCGGRTRRRS